MIRITVLAMIFFLTVSSARAQSIRDEAAEERLVSANTARSIRDAGIAMSVVGTTMAATGGGLLGGYFRDTRRDELALSGSLLVGFGAPVLFAGVPLAVLGAWVEKRLLDPHLDIEAAFQSARKVRATGIALTAPGIVLWAASIACSIASVSQFDPFNRSNTDEALLAVGVALGLAGEGLVAVGIPLWAGGSWAARRFQKINTPMQVSFSAAPTRDGASAQLTFTF